LEKKQYQAAVAMIDSAIKALPDHPLIKLRKAQILMEMGNKKEASPLVEVLEKLPWSDFYYPSIRQALAKLRES